MTKVQALFDFWSRFALHAYEENSVPLGKKGGTPDFPYITYEVETDSFGAEVPLSASLWYRDASWTAANAKEKEISEVIGSVGVFIPCEDGAVWIKRGSPFAQRMGDDSDDMVKRIYINITVEFWTEN